MTYRELLYIKTIAETGNMTKAASALYTTQPSLSHCLANVESRLGTKLFKRTQNGLKLTYAGERYCKVAHQILHLYKNFELEISDLNHVQSGKLTFGCTTYLATILLPKVLPLFHAQYPGIELEMVETTSTVMEEELLAGNLDFVIMHNTKFNPFRESECLKFYEVFDEPFVLAAPQDCPYRDQAVQMPGEPFPRLDLELVKDEGFLFVNSGQRIRQVSDYVLRMAGITPRVLFRSKSYNTLCRLAARGMGYTIAPLSYIQSIQGDDMPTCYSLDPRLGGHWSLILVMSNNYQSIACRKLLELIHSYFHPCDLPDFS